eukprot:4551133-Prymnesium_polylepis.1
MIEIEHAIEALPDRPQGQGNVITLPGYARRDKKLLDWDGMDVRVSSRYNIGQAAMGVSAATGREVVATRLKNSAASVRTHSAAPMTHGGVDARAPHCARMRAGRHPDTNERIEGQYTSEVLYGLKNLSVDDKLIQPGRRFPETVKHNVQFSA